MGYDRKFTIGLLLGILLGLSIGLTVVAIALQGKSFAPTSYTPAKKSIIPGQ